MPMKRGAVSRVAQRIDDEEETPRRRKKSRVGIDPRLIERAMREAHVETFGTALPREKKPRRRRPTSQVSEPSESNDRPVAAVFEPNGMSDASPPILYSRVERVSDEELTRMRTRLDELHAIIRAFAAVMAEWNVPPTAAVQSPADVAKSSSRS